MDPKPTPDYSQKYQMTYRIIRADQINDFLNELADMQQVYFEEAIEASQYKDAKEVINHIRSL